MEFLEQLGIKEVNSGASTGIHWSSTTKKQKIIISSPVDGKQIAGVEPCTPETLEHAIETAQRAFLDWRMVPPPKRGELVRKIGIEFRKQKDPLGRLISYEMGKSLQEGRGEVQEMIDICDFSVGQSRMLYGRTIASEREQHKMIEQYHPLGVVGVLTAFNFPAAVWAWNAMIGAVCGDVILWKPSSKVPLTAIAIQKIIGCLIKEDSLPEGIFSLVIGSGKSIGEKMIRDHRIPLISFTGSIPTGRHVAEVAAARFGKTILELGGNNAVILAQDADLKLAIPAIVFGAVGTAGQRCTTIRRLIVHESIFDRVQSALTNAYKSLRIGNPLDESIHMGPLIDRKAVDAFSNALRQVKSQGGKLICGGNILTGSGYPSDCYVEPAIVIAENHFPIVQEETFAPILYMIPYSGPVSHAIRIQNSVRQGLSSSIFTNSIRNAEEFLSPCGSDCGIANVNMGTSGAEIGGAFGGEKETGGGRESGSDAWKAYMRRQTSAVNYGNRLPLAQGIQFDL
ncbi:MAG: aldehyde dehydrogenase family protein [Pseudomonadota bacterium]